MFLCALEGSSVMVKNSVTATPTVMPIVRVTITTNAPACAHSFVFASGFFATRARNGSDRGRAHRILAARKDEEKGDGEQLGAGAEVEDLAEPDAHAADGPSSDAIHEPLIRRVDRLHRQAAFDATVYPSRHAAVAVARGRLL